MQWLYLFFRDGLGCPKRQSSGSKKSTVLWKLRKLAKMKKIMFTFQFIQPIPWIRCPHAPDQVPEPIAILFGLLALYLPWWHIDASVARAWTKQAASTGTKSAIPAMYNIVYVTTTNYTKSQLDYSIYAWTKKMNSILTQFMGHFKSVAMFWQSVVVLYFFYILG